MMGYQNSGQERPFYSFNLDDRVPANNLLCGIDQVLDLTISEHSSPRFTATLAARRSTGS
jgi:hypothetical protein